MSSTELSYGPHELELIDRGIEPGSRWLVRVNPDVTEEDAILKVHTIRDNGNIGYRLFTHGFLTKPSEIGNLVHALDVNTFIANVDKRHFVKL